MFLIVVNYISLPHLPENKMNKYLLNFLRWITYNEVPDSMLKLAHDFKQDGDKFSFKCFAKVNFKDWKCVSGRIK